jgi:hypothetical protein
MMIKKTKKIATIIHGQSQKFKNRDVSLIIFSILGLFIRLTFNIKNKQKFRKNHRLCGG